MSIAIFNILLMGFVSLVNPNYNFDIKLYIQSLLFEYLILLIIYVVVRCLFRLGKKAYINDALHINVNEDKNYYRDILKSYSILEIALINKMSRLDEYDIISAILSLKLKGVIEVRDNTITKINKNITLPDNEKYLLDRCISGKIELDNFYDLTKIVQNDALHDNLIVKSEKVTKKIFLQLLKTLGVTIVLILLFISLAKIVIDTETNELFSLLIGSILTGLLFIIPFLCVYFVTYAFHKICSYEVTNKGKEISNKLKGLKHYLQDFSNLSQTDIEKLVLWEDYLIYSIMFKQNKSIMRDMKHLLNIKEISKIFIFIMVFLLCIFFMIIL